LAPFPRCNVLIRADLVLKALVAEPLEKRAEEVVAGVELVVILDDELPDSRDGVRIHELVEHIVL
jgi:hypothetical protein